MNCAPWGITRRPRPTRASGCAASDPRDLPVGALAGFVGVNEILGVHHRMILEFPRRLRLRRNRGGADGPQSSAGVVLASLLFGVLYQGGAELSFEIPAITRDMVVVIQGLVILFSGALANMPRPWLAALLSVLARRQRPAAAGEA